MAAGRPTKYSEKMLDKAYEYLKQCKDEEFEFHKTRGEKSDSYDRILKVKLPTHEGLAIYLGVVVSTIYEWAKQSDKFSKALDDIKQAQKERLLEKGLSGEYNSTIAKLILSSNHDMVERKDVTTKGEQMPQPLLSHVLSNHSSTEDSGTD